MRTRQINQVALVLSLSLPLLAFGASHSVKGYTKKDGTHIAPHRATDPDKTRLNNYSTKGNVNPYTGKEGTQDPYKKQSEQFN